MSLAAVVLAAGRGTRVGMPKALLDIDGEPFVARVVRTALAAGIERVIVVVGARADAVRPLVPIEAGSVSVVDNPDPESDALGSLRVALAALDVASIDGVIVWPVDHPAVRVETVREVITASESHPDCAIVPAFEGRGGHPTAFPRSMFEALRDERSGGARAVLRTNAERVVRIAVSDPAVVRDVDTREDYEAMKRR